MKIFYYWDNSKGHHSGGCLFSCAAMLITEADVLFEATTGINPVKAPHVGVSF